MTAVTGNLTFTQVDASTLAAPAAGYLITFAEAGGATAPAPVAVALDSTSFSVSLDVGTWTASAVTVDAAGNALTAAVVSAPLTLSAPAVVLVNVPATVTLSAAA